MLAVANYEAMSEMLFVFLVLAASTCLIPALGSGGGRTPLRMLAGGGLLGLATLTRPVGLYLVVVYLAGGMAIGLTRRRPAAALRGAAMTAVAVLLFVMPWVARNTILFSIPRLTTVDNTNLVYFVGAGGYQLRHHLTLEEAQERISREFELPPYPVVQNPWVADRSIAEMDAALREAAPRVLGKYPAELALSLLLGTAKAGFSHNSDQLAALLGRKWLAPGLRPLLGLRGEAFARLRANGPVLALAFCWQVLHTMTALAAALLGIRYVLRDGAARPLGLILLAVLAYFYLSIGLFGFEAYCRCRIPALPFLYLFAGAGLAGLLAPARQAAAAGSSGAPRSAIEVVG